MKFISRAFSGLVLFAVTIALLAFAVMRLQQSFSGAQDEKPRMPRERSFAVDVEVASPIDVNPQLELFGEVQARRSLEIRATRSGKIINLAPAFRDGTAIFNGQLLYGIDQGIAQNSVTSSKLSLTQAQAELEQAVAARDLTKSEVRIAERQLEIEQGELSRQRGLLEKGLVSQSAVEKAEQALANMRQSLSGKNQAMLAARIRADNAVLSVDRASIGIEDARQNLDDSNFYAPFDGVLAQTSVTAGSRVAANEKLGLLIDPNSLEVSMRVRDSQIARLLNADGNGLSELPVSVSLDIGSRKISMTGTLDRIAATVDASLGGRQVFARLDSSVQTIIRPGDLVSVLIEEPVVENVVSLAARSLTTDDSVYVVGKDERIELRRVEVVHRYDDTALVRGISEGDVVVVNPQPQLGVGVKVATNQMPDAAGGRQLSGESTSPARQASQPPGGDGDGLITIESARRERLIAAVEANSRIPEDRRKFIVNSLKKDQVPRKMIERIESRMPEQ